MNEYLNPANTPMCAKHQAVLIYRATYEFIGEPHYDQHGMPVYQVIYPGFYCPLCECEEKKCPTCGQDLPVQDCEISWDGQTLSAEKEDL